MQAPEGYHLNSEVFTTELIDGQAATVTIPDKIKTGLIIRKVDAETGEPLAGAVFTVTRPSGEMVGEYITGQNGLVVIESLTEGAYVVTEIQPPEGYLLDGDNARKTVNLSWETSQELVFRDFAKPRLLLKKIDGDTGEYLLDAQEKEVLLEAGKLVSIQFENKPLNPILIKKADQDGKPLAGAFSTHPGLRKNTAAVAW